MVCWRWKKQGREKQRIGADNDDAPLLLSSFAGGGRSSAEEEENAMAEGSGVSRLVAASQLAAKGARRAGACYRERGGSAGHCCGESIHLIHLIQPNPIHINSSINWWVK